MDHNKEQPSRAATAKAAIKMIPKWSVPIFYKQYNAQWSHFDWLSRQEQGVQLLSLIQGRFM